MKYVRSLALAALAAAACRSPAAPPPATPVAVAPVAASADAGAAAPDAPPPSLCERVLARHRAALAALPVAAESPWAEPLATFGRCVPTPGGAWAVTVDSLERVDADGQWMSVRGRWSVVHVTAGAEVRLSRDEEWIYHHLPAVQGAVTSDYDGNGEPELVLLRGAAVAEGADVRSGEVLTFRDGAVTPYAPADGIVPDEARDVDGDGRLDLVTRTPYRADGDDSPSDFTYLMEGPPLLAHALAGGSFARDDEAAQRFAREGCPRRVAGVFPATIAGDSGGLAVTCARLWGVPAATVARVVRARCASPEENGGGNPRRPHCGDTRVLLRWAAAAPPLTLR